MVIIQVLSHNAVIAKEKKQKGEWILVRRGIGFGRKHGDVINENGAQRYQKIE